MTKDEEIYYLKSQIRQLEEADLIRNIGQGEVFIKRMKLDMKIADEMHNLRDENASLKNENKVLNDKIEELKNLLKIRSSD